MALIEFSQFTNGSALQIGDTVVGLRGGVNTKFTFSAVLSVTGTANEITVVGTTAPIISIANNPILPGSAGVSLPEGNTAARAGSAGTIRFNTQTDVFEGTPDGSNWYAFLTGSGTVNSVTGTAGQIDVVPTTGNCVVSIDPAYVGQTSIVTLGIVTTGTWNASVIAGQYGGTGVANTGKTITVGGNFAMSGAFTFTGTLTGNTAVTFPTSGTLATTAGANIPSLAQGDMLYASAANVLSALNKDTNATRYISNTGTSNNPAWAQINLANGVTGTLPATNGGTGLSTYATGDTIYASAANTLSKLTGNVTIVKQYLSQTGDGVNSAAPVWATISGGDITGAALTKVDDTNVTLTLGGTPATALLRAASITAGWTGQLSLTRGGTNASLTASNGGIVYSTASALAILSGTATANQVLLSGSSTTPAWSTATYPATTTINQILYSSSANVIAGLATANKAVLTTGATGIPVLTAIATDGQIIIGSTAGSPAAATLTAGSGVTITNAGNSITIAATGSGGTVTSVSGTTDRITSTGGTTPVIDIAATYVGQTSITTLGTISTGTWAGTNIALNHGGTNAALTASNGGIFYSTASAGAILSGTATALQMLQSGASGAPAWSTTTWPATTTANRILYSSATSVIGEITSANSATLFTNTSGVPAFTGSMTNGQLLIGSTGASPALATITAGTGISVTNGAGSITIAASGSASAVTKISSSTASSSASIAFTGLSNTYMAYWVIIDRALPATDAVGFEVQVSTDNGSTYKTTNEYDYADMIPWNTDGSYNARGGSGVGAILVTGTDSSYNIGNAANRGITGEFYIYNPSNAAYGRTTGNFSFTTAGGALRASNHAGVFNSATAINAIRFLFSSGNIASGTFTLYGILA